MSKSSSKKKKTNVFRFINKETGEHYTVRLGKSASECLGGERVIKKFCKKLKKHSDFVLTKKVK